jgi:hypothetical protein
MLIQATEQCVPKAKPRTRRHYKPLWENPRALTAVKKKKQAWTRYLASDEGTDYIMYLRYKKARNTARKEARRAVKINEREMANACKENPKKFWAYTKSKTKPTERIPTMKDEGYEITDDQAKADAFNDFFSSVFTKEDLLNIPVMESRDIPKFDIPNITVDMERKKLAELKTHKSPPVVITFILGS